MLREVFLKLDFSAPLADSSRESTLCGAYTLAEFTEDPRRLAINTIFFEKSQISHQFSHVRGTYNKIQFVDPVSVLKMYFHSALRAYRKYLLVIPRFFFFSVSEENIFPYMPFFKN